MDWCQLPRRPRGSEALEVVLEEGMKMTVATTQNQAESKTVKGRSPASLERRRRMARWEVHGSDLRRLLHLLKLSPRKEAHLVVIEWLSESVTLTVYDIQLAVGWDTHDLGIMILGRFLGGKGRV